MNLLRVMVVDDDPQFQYLLAATLRPRFEIVPANSGLDGLLKLERTEPDFLIVDVSMPVMDGIEFVRRLRGVPSYENTLVIFLSARGDNDQIDRAYHSGGNIYLTKPIDPDRLNFILDKLIADRMITGRKKTFSLEALKRNPGTSPPNASSRIARSTMETRDYAESSRKTTSAPKPDRTNARADSPQRPSESPGRAPSGKPQIYVQGETPIDHAAESESRYQESRPEDRLLRVLLADGNAERRRLLGDELARHFEVILATDGLEAVGHAFHWRPDFFILDWKMPGVSGLQLVRVIKAAAEFEDAPLVIISAPRRYAEAQRLLQLGVSSFLADPVSTTDLSTLTRHLSAGLIPRRSRPPLPADRPEASKSSPWKATGPAPKTQNEDSLHWEG